MLAKEDRPADVQGRLYSKHHQHRMIYFFNLSLSTVFSVSFVNPHSLQLKDLSVLIIKISFTSLTIIPIGTFDLFTRMKFMHVFYDWLKQSEQFHDKTL